MSTVHFPPPRPPPPPPPGAPGSDRRMAADAKFGPGAGDAFKQAFDTLHPGPGQDPRFGDAAGKLDAALRSGDLASLQSAAQALEGLVKDKIANPAQAGGLASAIAVLKNKIAALQSTSSSTSSSDGFDSGTSSTAATSTSSSGTTSSSTSTTTASVSDNVDRVFGAGGYGRLNAAMGVLATNPAYGNAGMALGYVMNTVASKSTLDGVDRGAIQQAIIQMQSLVGSRAVNPAQAGVLNNAIWNLQGALR